MLAGRIIVGSEDVELRGRGEGFDHRRSDVGRGMVVFEPWRVRGEKQDAHGLTRPEDRRS